MVKSSRLTIFIGNFFGLMYFSQNIKHLRKKFGLSQKDLSDQLGIGQTAVASYETGANTPKFEGMLKLSELFKVTLDDLIWKDLSVEAPSGGMKVEEQIAALEQRIAMLEELIKAKNPELAERLGL